MMAAMGAEPRLRIMRLLLSAHPDGLVVGDIQEELRHQRIDAVPPPRETPSRGPRTTTREGTFLRYTVNTESLRTLLAIPLRGVLRPQPGGLARRTHQAVRLLTRAPPDSTGASPCPTSPIP